MAIYVKPIQVVDENNVPLNGDFYLDGAFIANGTSHSYILNTGNTNTLSFVPTNSAYGTWSLVFKVPDYSLVIPPSTVTITILPNTFDTQAPGLPCGLDLVEYPCSNEVLVFSTVVYPIQPTITWTFGDGTSGSGESVYHSYYFAGQYSIGMEVKICISTMIPGGGCCGAPEYTLECNTCTSGTDVTIENFVPETSFVVRCFEPGQVYVEGVTTTTNCIDLCGGCTCQDQASCRCIALNQVIYLVSFATFNNDHCAPDLNPAGDDITYEWFINGVSVATGIVTPPDVIPIYSLSFDTKGKYDIKLVVCNCCACCEYTTSIYVGNPLELVKVDCHNYQFNDYNLYPSPVTIHIEVLDTEGQLVQEHLVPNFNGSAPINFELPDDGIYVIEYEVVSPIDGTIFKQTRFVVYEYCEVLKCYEKLVVDSMCPTGNCPDPVKVVQFGQQLSTFMSLASAFYMALNIKAKPNSNIFNILPGTSIESLKNDRVLLEGLKKICGDCGYIKLRGCSNC